MKIELRKISHSKTLSEETPAYTADLYVDGVLLAHVSNHGHGGCDMQHPAKGKTWDDIQRLNDTIKTTYPPLKSQYFEDGLPMDLELFCHMEIDRVELQKTVKRDLSKKIVFTKADGKLYQIKKPASGDQTADLIAKLRNRGDKVLNEMSIEDAIKVYETMGA